LRVASRSASLALPTRFCALPATLSALPSASVLASPVALPTVSLTLPLTSRAAPSIRSLSMMVLIDCPFADTNDEAGRKVPISRAPSRSLPMAGLRRDLEGDATRQILGVGTGGAKRGRLVDAVAGSDGQ